MLFNSWVFLAFLAVVFTIYYSMPRLRPGSRAQLIVLCVSSLVFYAYEIPSLVFLLLASVAFNTIVSSAIVRAAQHHGPGQRWLVLGVVINLLVLAFFKYAYLFVSLLFPGQTLDAFKATVASIPLPIGISFYTFHSISLLVDLYTRGVVGVQSLEDTFARGRHLDGFLRVTLYISFFPQLIAGPIVKAHQFFDQIKPKFIRDIDWHSVLGNVITGYFLKMVIADNLKDVTRLLTSDKLSVLGRLDLIALLYGYSFQIFADFAGYSLIAIGLGHLFGYRLPTNFNFPYISASVTEFWRRWHISLSSFLRDYLYIPLGGNRKGPYRTYFNLFVVMFLGGLWHGAAWRFAFWGVSHGVLLAFEKLLADRRGGRERNRSSSRLVHLVKIVVTFHVVSFLWLTFIMPDASRVFEYLRLLFTTPVLVTSLQNLYVVFIYAVPVIVYHVAAYLHEYPLATGKEAGEGVGGLAWLAPRNLQAVSLAVMLSLIVLNSGTAGAFIYFQF
jgi:alginate O-acetyltransferase complex protein AlgI